MNAIIEAVPYLPMLCLVIQPDFTVVCSSKKWDSRFGSATSASILTIPFVSNNLDLWKEKVQKASCGESTFLIEKSPKLNHIYRWELEPIAHKAENYILISRHIASGPEEVRKAKLRHDANKVAGIGYWELDMRVGKPVWSIVTKNIHGVPADYEPTLEEGIHFYKEGFSRDKINEVIQHTIKTQEPWNEDLIITTAKGEDVWINARGEGEFINGECIRLLGTFQDISQSKAHDIAIIESERRFRMTFDNTLIASFLTDTLDMKIVEVNAAAERIFGYSKDVFVQEMVIGFIMPEHRDNISREIQRLLMGAIQSIDTEVYFLHKSGKRITGHTSITLNKDSENKPFNLIWQISDITELNNKKAEVAKFIDVTTRQNSRLVNFAHIVSHNLRSHTSNISMLVDFLIDEKDEEERMEQFGMLQSASNMLSETIVELNKVVAMDVDVKNMDSIDLCAAIDAMSSSVQGLIIENKLSVINNVPQNYTILVVHAYLDSILLNFMTNAMKYKSPDRNPFIKFSAEKQGTKDIITIEDNGMGIDLERHGHKVFGLYKTFHGNEDSKGLGLYMTKSQIEVMGGNIELESTVNAGTTFKIILNGKN